MDTESSGSAESEDEVGSYHVTKPNGKMKLKLFRPNYHFSYGV